MHARLIRCAMTGLVLVVTGGSSVVGCLDRPVVPGEPSTKTNFTTQFAEHDVDKLDISSSSIDNSASMGDKQAYLEKAIPDLITRLITPNCVSNADNVTVTGTSTIAADGTASCPSGSAPRFPAVHDMHIGVVSSSLGPRLGDKQPADGSGGECIATSSITINGVNLNNHDDDQAHLINRSSDPSLGLTDPPTENPLADASSGFLAWFPNAAANTGKTSGVSNPVTSAATLQSDFADLIAGVHEYGCGIESQLENWYRFLIQPDPYASLSLTSAGKAQWVGVDTTILKQRHDFLRPDSLVAIVDLTDENDSEIDVRSIGGQGYLFMSTKFFPPHGTTECATDPSNSACTTQGSGDATPYNSPTDWGYDLNLRHVHMKAKYGIDAQFPISRYVNGLTSGTVPDRATEYPDPTARYDTNVGDERLREPALRSLAPRRRRRCRRAPRPGTTSARRGRSSASSPPSSARSKNLIFYAVIGGVPWQLLHFDPTSAKNSLLSSDDWVRILGTDPDNFNYTGIDPHMVESYAPRVGADRRPRPSSRR